METQRAQRTRRRLASVAVAAGLAAALVAAPAAAQVPGPVGAHVADPALDRPDLPFSYPSRPTDVIGVMDGRGTEVTPEGFLYTGYGELMLFAGSGLKPLDARVKTLYHEHYPIVLYGDTRDGLHYRVAAFAATLDGNPESPLVNFLRLDVHNPLPTPAAGFWAVASRYDAPSAYAGARADNRFRRPVTAARKGGYDQPGVPFDPEWTYGFRGDAFLRDGKVFYLFPTDPAPFERLALREEYRMASDTSTRRLRPQITEPVGQVEYRIPLAPGESRTLIIKMPYAPVAPDDPLVTALRSASWDDYFNRTVAFWDGVYAHGMSIDLQERKVTDTWRASLMYDLIARDKKGEDYVQTVNEFQYHAFWLRDASYIARAYEVAGHPEYARQVLDFFAGWQQPDGNFVSQGGQFDGWGETLWAYGQHYRMTGDPAFAEKVFPSVVKAVDWLEQATAADPLHLMPATTPGDNEEITGHVTGHTLWALAGLRNAIALADGLGRKAEAARFRRDYEELRSCLVARLNEITKATGGYIWPGLDGPGHPHGQDWDNMQAVYPEPILDPHDPLVTATLDSTRARYAEGVMTYDDGRSLHHYITMKNTETEVVRGDQRLALEELYAVLAHTSSTHAGFEWVVRAWGDRDFGLNLAPHGWFAASYVALLRDMLVREQGDELHLASVLSPEWLHPGDSVVVRGAPTEFGTVDFRLDAGDAGARLALATRWRRRPAAVVVHLPFFLDVTGAQADGRAVPVRDGAVRLTPGTRELRLTWTRRADAPALSYARSVEDLEAAYRKRWEEWLRTGH